MYKKKTFKKIIVSEVESSFVENGSTDSSHFINTFLLCCVCESDKSFYHKYMRLAYN